MYNEEFVKGLLARTPNVGMPLVLTFKQDADAVTSMRKLAALHGLGTLVVNEHYVSILSFVAKNGRFDGDEYRNILVNLHRSPSTDLIRNFFGLPERYQEIVYLVPYLESIRPGFRHSLKGLQSDDEKVRNTASEEVLSRFVTDKISYTLRDWKMTLDSEMKNDIGFHYLSITLRDEYGDMVHIYDVDGWSGLLFRDLICDRNVMITPERFEALVLADVEAHMERSTQVG